MANLKINIMETQLQEQYAKTLPEARELFKRRTGENYTGNESEWSVTIYMAEVGYFVGTFGEWINREPN